MFAGKGEGKTSHSSSSKLSWQQVCADHVAGMLAPNSEELAPIPASFKPRRSKPLAVLSSAGRASFRAQGSAASSKDLKSCSALAFMRLDSSSV